MLPTPIQFSMFGKIRTLRANFYFRPPTLWYYDNGNPRKFIQAWAQNTDHIFVKLTPIVCILIYENLPTF